MSPTTPPAVATPEQVAVISGAVDCRWADASTAIEPGATVSAGRRFVLASGLLQIWYDSRVEVILQGPAIYEADSPNGGFLSLGRLTARVEKRPDADSREPTAPGAAAPVPHPDFTIRTPSAVLANQDTMPRPGVLGSAEFGVVVDSPDVTRVHVFRGLVTTRLVGGGPSDATAVPLVANRSLLLARDGSRGMTDLSQKARMGDVLFARRAVVPLDGQREQLAWLNAIGSGHAANICRRRQRRRLRVAAADGLAGSGRKPAAAACHRCVPRRPALAGGIVYTCRLTFDLGRPDPATAMLRCDYVAATALPRSGSTARAFRRSQAAAAKAATARKRPASSSFTGACSRVISSPEPTFSRST